jgi:putative ABC transport system permease protein
MIEVLDRYLALRWFNTVLVSLFAGSSLLLAMLGIYGVIAWTVRQRTREIGVRMALGAQRSAVLALVLRNGLKLAGAGIVLGLIGAMALTHLLRSLLFGVGPTDPFTLAVVPLVLVSVALLACWLPARRAARVDPMVALRTE